MNATFETVRKELKKYYAEDNEAPTKLLVADRNDFLIIERKRKRNSQFILGVKEFSEPDKFLIEELLDDLEVRSGRRPLAFFYDDRAAIETVIKDFEDYYNMPLGNHVFQKIGSSTNQGELQFYLIIVVLEIYYYEA